MRSRDLRLALPCHWLIEKFAWLIDDRFCQAIAVEDDLESVTTIPRNALSENPTSALRAVNRPQSISNVIHLPLGSKHSYRLRSSLCYWRRSSSALFQR